MPWYPSESDTGQENYEVGSQVDKMVADWMNISLLDVVELDYVTYLQMRRDAFITRMRQSQEGRDWLDKAWLLEQTEPDREKSRKIFGGGD